MATKRFKELKNLSDNELGTKVREIEAELFKARMQRVTGQLKDTASIWRMRKDLARAKMLLTQKGVTLTAGTKGTGEKAPAPGKAAKSAAPAPAGKKAEKGKIAKAEKATVR